MIDFVRRWSQSTEIGAARFIGWLGVATSKFYDWRERYGCVNEHNGWVPRDFWLEDWEKQAILDFHLSYPEEGYRRLTFMMLDRNIVAVSPVVAGFVEYYDTVRLHSAIGYVTPQDMLDGRQQEIFAERDRKREAARELRQIRRQQAAAGLLQ